MSRFAEKIRKKRVSVCVHRNRPAAEFCFGNGPDIYQYTSNENR